MLPSVHRKLQDKCESRAQLGVPGSCTILPPKKGIYGYFDLHINGKGVCPFKYAYTPSKKSRSDLTKFLIRSDCETRHDHIRFWSESDQNLIRSFKTLHGISDSGMVLHASGTILVCIWYKSCMFRFKVTSLAKWFLQSMHLSSVGVRFWSKNVTE